MAPDTRWFQKRGAAAFTALLALTSACRQTLAPPERGWTEAKSRHFVVRTDLDREEAVEITREFERSYAALRSCIYPTAEDLADTTRVVVLENVVDYDLIAPRGALAFFSTRRFLGETFQSIVMPAHARLPTREVFQHELAHRFVSHYFPQAKMWVQEGMAELMSTALIEGDEVVLGTPPSKYTYDGSDWTAWRQPLASLAPQLEELRGLSYGQFMREPNRAYGGAWMFVHVLSAGEARARQAFERYLSDLHAGRLSDEAAFSRHFDAPLQDSIAAAYSKLPKLRDPPAWAVRLVFKPEANVEATSLPASAAHALWGRLRLAEPGEQRRAMQDAERAISANPSSAEGYLLRAALRDRSREDSGAVLLDLRQAIELEPGSPVAMRALGQFLLRKGRPAFAEVSWLAQLIERSASSAEDFEFLALVAVNDRRPEQALELALRGQRMNSRCAKCYEIAAVAALRSRKPDLAVQYQEIAINVAAERAESAMFARLDRYRTRLAKARAAGER